MKKIRNDPKAHPKYFTHRKTVKPEAYKHDGVIPGSPFFPALHSCGQAALQFRS
jgi:hypothetical protein|tara:strand:- start:673 stop:834 length:162 start_codon:yes stop_codon:yes gene_type:complete